ncbi:hypothetical protein HDU81_003469 [Chytriomyces hyalinus]|nr:hypothetical protein HDU81_003469 [Chytriomyces hyalinus]
MTTMVCILHGTSSSTPFPVTITDASATVEDLKAAIRASSSPTLNQADARDLTLIRIFKDTVDDLNGEESAVLTEEDQNQANEIVHEAISDQDVANQTLNIANDKDSIFRHVPGVCFKREVMTPMNTVKDYVDTSPGALYHVIVLAPVVDGASMEHQITISLKKMKKKEQEEHAERQKTMQLGCALRVTCTSTRMFLPEYQVNYSTEGFNWDMSRESSEATAAVLAFIDATFGGFPALKVYDGHGNDPNLESSACGWGESDYYPRQYDSGSDSEGDGNNNRPNAKIQRRSHEAAKFEFQIEKLGEREVEKQMMAQLETDRNGFYVSVIVLFIRENRRYLTDVEKVGSGDGTAAVEAMDASSEEEVGEAMEAGDGGVRQESDDAHMQPASIADLPLELVQQILQWIHPSTVLRYSRVCRHLHAGLSDHHFALLSLRLHIPQDQATTSRETSSGSDEFDGLWVLWPAHFQQRYTSLPRTQHLKSIHWLQPAHERSLSRGFIPDSIGMVTGLAQLCLTGFNTRGQSLDIYPGLFELNQLQVLKLRNNNIGGRIPDAFGNLRSLVHLDLSLNHLDGPLPSALFTLEHLEHVDLQSNNLNGPIDLAIVNLQHLQVLILSQNALTGPIPVKLPSTLQHVNLSQNQFTGQIPSSIWTLSSLTSLNLGRNNLSGIVSLADKNLAHTLSTLNLSHNMLQVTSIPSAPLNLSVFFEGQLDLNGPLEADLVGMPNSSGTNKSPSSLLHLFISLNPLRV